MYCFHYNNTCIISIECSEMLNSSSETLVEIHFII